MSYDRLHVGHKYGKKIKILNAEKLKRKVLLESSLFDSIALKIYFFVFVISIIIDNLINKLVHG